MTVGELAALLVKVDQELPVVVRDRDLGDSTENVKAGVVHLVWPSEIMWPTEKDVFYVEASV